MNAKNTVFVSFAMAATLCIGTATAQDDMGTQLAKLGGAAHQTARLCKHYSQPELDRLKQGQKVRHAEQGFDMGSFESSFAAAEAEVRSNWEAASEAERSATCAQLEALLQAAGAGMQ